MLIVDILIPLLVTFYGSEGVLNQAPSNKAARGIGGKTIHSAQGLTPDNSLRTYALAPNTEARRKLQATVLNAGAKLIDERFMLSGTLHHADALRTTYAREGKYNLKEPSKIVIT